MSGDRIPAKVPSSRSQVDKFSLQFKTTTNRKQQTMPLVQIKGVSDYLTQNQKEEMIRKVTDAVVSVEGEGLRPVTWVLVEEVASGSWGVGGQPVTTEGLRKMAAGN